MKQFSELKKGDIFFFLTKMSIVSNVKFNIHAGVIDSIEKCVHEEDLILRVQFKLRFIHKTELYHNFFFKKTESNKLYEFWNDNSTYLLKYDLMHNACVQLDSRHYFVASIEALRIMLMSNSLTFIYEKI